LKCLTKIPQHIERPQRLTIFHAQGFGITKPDPDAETDGQQDRNRSRGPPTPYSQSQPKQGRDHRNDRENHIHVGDGLPQFSPGKQISQCRQIDRSSGPHAQPLNEAPHQNAGKAARQQNADTANRHDEATDEQKRFSAKTVRQRRIDKLADRKSVKADGENLLHGGFRRYEAVFHFHQWQDGQKHIQRHGVLREQKAIENDKFPIGKLWRGRMRRRHYVALARVMRRVQHFSHPAKLVSLSARRHAACIYRFRGHRRAFQ
jgi:hypothetical protein